MTLVAKQLRLLLKSRPLLPAFLFLVLAACDAGPEFQRLSGSTMGTSWSASWAGSRGEGERQNAHPQQPPATDTGLDRDTLHLPTGSGHAKASLAQ